LACSATKVASGFGATMRPNNGQCNGLLWGVVTFADIYVGQPYFAGFEVNEQQAEPVATHRITAWGHCGVCRHDRIPGEGCARQECPDSPQQQAEPVAVVDEVIHAAWAAGFVEGEKAALEQQAEPVGWLDGNDKLADFMHRDLKAEHDKRGSATPKDFTIPVYTAPLQQQAEPVGEVTAAVDGAFKCEFSKHLPVGTKLYTTSPQRKPLTMQPIVQDKRGVFRFKRNGLVDALYEHGVKTGLSLNELHCMDFTDEDRQQFAQLIGYSVSGYGSLNYVSDEAYEAAEQAAHGIKEGT